jgi:hypothetical protein
MTLNLYVSQSADHEARKTADKKADLSTALQFSLGPRQFFQFLNPKHSR